MRLPFQKHSAAIALLTLTMPLGLTAESDDGQNLGHHHYINSKSQVVGLSFSCDRSSASAFLWEHGSIVDLNTLLTPNPNLLVSALFASDGGEIAGLELLPSGDQHVVLLIPCDENHHVEGCDYSMVETETKKLGVNWRIMPRPQPPVSFFGGKTWC